MANYDETMSKIIVDHRESNRASFVSQWIRTTPDPVENMFGSIFYFMVPKSYLGQGVKMFLLVKDEREPSLTSFPTEVVGFAKPPQGKKSINILVNRLF